MPGGHRDALANGLAGHVVPEGQAIAALDEDSAVNKLLHGLEQRGRGPVEHVGQVSEREPATQRSSDRGCIASRSRDAPQALAHREADAVWKTRLQQPRATADNADQLFVSEARQELHEDQWAAMRALDEVEERVIRHGVNDILSHLGHCGVVQRADDDPFGPILVEMLDRAAKLRRALLSTECEDPSDWQVGEPRGQRAQGRCSPAIRPLQVIQRDQHRPVERGALQHRLEVLQQPVPLLGQRAERS